MSERKWEAWELRLPAEGVNELWREVSVDCFDAATWYIQLPPKILMHYTSQTEEASGWLCLEIFGGNCTLKDHEKTTPSADPGEEDCGFFG